MSPKAAKRWHWAAAAVHLVGLVLGLYWASHGVSSYGLLAGWSLAFGAMHTAQARKP